MRSRTEKCVYRLHIHFCPTFFYLSPYHALSSFLFQWRDMEDRRQGERWGGRHDGLLQRSAEKRQTSTVQFSAAVHPSSSSQSQACVYLSSLCSSYLGPSLLVWTMYNTKHRQTLGSSEGQFSNPDFPYSTVLSDFMSRDTNIAEPVCCQPEEQHSRLQPGRRIHDGG